MTRPAERLDAETIIADFLTGLFGTAGGLEHWRPAAQQLIGWLGDEGWSVTPTDTAAR